MSFAACCLVLLVAIVPASAQQPGEPILLTIRPAAAPVPALKYQLLPDLRDQTPGNAALMYYRAFSPEFTYGARRPEVRDKIYKWSEKLRQVPPKELQQALGGLKQVDVAARREFCDWEMTARLRKEGMHMLMGDLQGLREFATLLALRARFEIADGQGDKAVYTLQTGLALSRHLAEGPTLIQALIGLANANVMLVQAEELIQMPGSPNLYWALTYLPRPFIDIRKPLQGERLMVGDSLFPGLRELLADPKTGPVSPHQFRTSVDNRVMLGDNDRLTLAAQAVKLYPEAKQALLARGWTAEQVEALPIVQVALLYEVMIYDRVFEDMIKWQGLPFWESRPKILQLEARIKAARSGPEGAGMTLAAVVIPAFSKALGVPARTDRRIAALRCIEAIRLYAAGHDGKLPAQLSDIQEVPVPIDPMTGKAFEYKVTGDRATLKAFPPSGAEAVPHLTLTYELTLKK